MSTLKTSISEKEVPATYKSVPADLNITVRDYKSSDEFLAGKPVVYSVPEVGLYIRVVRHSNYIICAHSFVEGEFTSAPFKVGSDEAEPLPDSVVEYIRSKYSKFEHLEYVFVHFDQLIYDGEDVAWFEERGLY